MATVRHSFVIALAISSAALLAGCTGYAPEPVPAPSTTKPTDPSPSATPEPDPTLDPAGTAEDNLPYFDHVNLAFLEGGNSGGRPIIDNLVAAGFDRGAMQVTPDKTAIGGDVDSLQFSVQFDSECLIGQADADGYTSVVGPALASGGCLVGTTRSIDW